MVPKFRAWNGYSKMMADYVSAIQNGDTQGTPSSVNVIVNGKNETWDIKNDHVELLQYTGLKDANGKEIYDNDIVEVVSQYWGQLGNRYKVKFNKGAFSVKHDLLAVIRSSILVIGNIHTNPELLEAQHDTRTD
ncbi:YopX family protein [Levilactobacillus brevis]|uniref:YopX family protein n=1 Tax=Levilactobacillus brevis TaxID=1580 RepID=UPI002072EF6D|nr:YopX family protein [Levilactobacillus brevis]